MTFHLSLIPTLYQKKAQVQKIEQGVQIIHDKGNQYIAASTLVQEGFRFMILFMVAWMKRQRM